MISIVFFVSAIIVINVPAKNQKKDKESNRNEIEEKGINIKGGILPSCSAGDLTEEDYKSENSNDNIVFTNVNYITDKNGNRLNNSKLMKKVHEYQGITINSISITSERCHEKYAKLSASVTNNSGKDSADIILNFTFIDNSGKELNLIGLSLSPLKNGETITIYDNFGVRIIDAYDYTLSISNIEDAVG